MEVKNLLHQPLELDFGKEVIRFKAREIREVADKYANHEVFKRNASDLHVFAKPKAVKEKAIDVQTKK